MYYLASRIYSRVVMDCCIQVSWKVSQPAALKYSLGLGVGGGQESVCSLWAFWKAGTGRKNKKIIQHLLGVGLGWGGLVINSE